MHPYQAILARVAPGWAACFGGYGADPNSMSRQKLETLYGTETASSPWPNVGSDRLETLLVCLSAIVTKILFFWDFAQQTQVSVQ